jgi:mRNA interferase MazF
VTVRQGDVYWLDLGDPRGSGPGLRHPHVVVQNNVFNASRIATVVVCALTSNLARALAPGNVRLRKGEANLKRDCVVNISQLVTVDRSDLVEIIGTLSQERVLEIVEGIELLVTPRELDRPLAPAR